MDVDSLLTTLLTTLLQEEGADRVTLRLDVPGMNFPCIGEATGAGIASIEANNSLDQRGAASVQWIMKTRQILVQPDVRLSDTPPPQPLIDSYGVLAQMLAPIEESGDVVGWISVHSTTVRPWSVRDVERLRTAAHDTARAVEEIRQGAGYQRWLSTSDQA